MAELGDAYYPSSLDDDNGSVPKGRYTATITDLSISNNVKGLNNPSFDFDFFFLTPFIIHEISP